MKADIENEADFEKTPDGFAALVKWLEETYNQSERATLFALLTFSDEAKRRISISMLEEC